MSRANVTNKQIAEVLGLDHTTVSRYRSGDRIPSFEVMAAIATEYNWDLNLQALSRKANVWHEGFEAALATTHGEVDDDVAPEAVSGGGDRVDPQS
jgi:transcriptional regulator with XRE-family HTH domain